MKRFLPLSSIILSLYIFGACGDSSPNPETTLAESETPQQFRANFQLDSKPDSIDDKLVAEWNGGKLYLSQINKILEPRKRKLREVTQDENTIDQMIAKERPQIVETLVDNYLLLMEARDQDVILSPLDQDQIRKEIHSRFNTQEEYEAYLKQSGDSEESLFQVLANIRIGQKCVQNEQKKVKKEITTEYMKAYYEENKKMFTPPHRSAVNRIIIRENETRTLEEAEKLAKRLYNEVQEKINHLDTFDEKRKVMQEYAEKYSDAAEAKINYGFIYIYHDDSAKESYTKEFLDELLRVKVGELSSLVRTKKGYGFFFPKEQIPSRANPFESKAIQRMLPNMILVERMKEWRESLKDKFNLHVYYENLDLPPNMEKYAQNIYPSTKTVRSTRPSKSPRPVMK